MVLRKKSFKPLNGKDFKELEQPFISLTDSIILHAQTIKHTRIAFFHSSDKKEASYSQPRTIEVPLYYFIQIPAEQQPSFRVLTRLEKSYLLA
jgi:hypothetical protein